jgi:capsular polysaccharide biosynthesis protein
MTQDNRQKDEWEEYLGSVRKHYRMIIILVVLACIAAAVITFFIPKEYASSAVVFPTETNSLDDVLRNPQFGYDIEADRLMQILQSRPVRDSIAKKFDLLHYFDIEKSDPAWDYKLKTKYEKYIQLGKTIYMSIIISARTRVPEMSANIVNSIIVEAGKARERLLKQNVQLARTSLRSEYSVLKNDLDSLGNVVNGLTRSQKNIKQYVQADRYISLIIDKDQLKNDQAGKALQTVVNQYNTRLTWFYDVQTRLKNADLMSLRPLPSIYVVEPAVPSYKKIYPKYSINIGLALAGSFLFISLLFFFIDKVSKSETTLED